MHPSGCCPHQGQQLLLPGSIPGLLQCGICCHGCLLEPDCRLLAVQRCQHLGTHSRCLTSWEESGSQPGKRHCQLSGSSSCCHAYATATAAAAATLCWPGAIRSHQLLQQAAHCPQQCGLAGGFARWQQPQLAELRCCSCPLCCRVPHLHTPVAGNKVQRCRQRAPHNGSGLWAGTTASCCQERREGAQPPRCPSFGCLEATAAAGLQQLLQGQACQPGEGACCQRSGALWAELRVVSLAPAGQGGTGPVTSRWLTGSDWRCWAEAAAAETGRVISSMHHREVSQTGLAHLAACQHSWAAAE